MKPRYKCKCGVTDHLVVLTSVWAVVSPAPQQVATKVAGDFDWDIRSDMECGKCGWKAEASVFAAIADQALTSDELQTRYEVSHPLVTKYDWRGAVAMCDTEHGYWEWVRYQLPFEVAGLVDM